MSEPTRKAGPPVAVGGLGGSGTRVAASVLQTLGLFIGGELNHALDNLWYAFLFGRRDILVADPAETDALIYLFRRQMSDPRPLDAAERRLLEGLGRTRAQHGEAHLEAWADSFVAYGETGTPAPDWGWKVPYSHILIDRLLEAMPDLRYVHMSRHALDMAYSRNANQVRYWGPILLDSDAVNTRAAALSFWCAVHRRMKWVAQRFPGRVHFLDYDALIDEPRQVLQHLLAFLGRPQAPDALDALAAGIAKPKTVGRYRSGSLNDFSRADLEYLEGLGYVL